MNLEVMNPIFKRAGISARNPKSTLAPLKSKIHHFQTGYQSFLSILH
jgi:hypothetical protein